MLYGLDMLPCWKNGKNRWPHIRKSYQYTDQFNLLTNDRYNEKDKIQNTQRAVQTGYARYNLQSLTENMEEKEKTVAEAG